MTDELDDLEALAADYVLGTLGADERRRAENLRVRDPGFDQLVGEWSRRLSPLADAVPARPPPPGVWEKIERSIGERQGTITPIAAGRPDRRSGAGPATGLWRLWAVGATAAAAALAFHVATTEPPAPDTRFVAVLSESPDSPAWVVTVDTAALSMTIRPVTDIQVADNSLELWLVRSGEEAPRSLGLLDPGGEIALPIATVYRPDEPGDAALAVSLEPVGGSPTGQPTGPVLYHGALLRVGGTPL